MPNLHVAVEIQNNRFKIRSGVPGKKVSWRVEAIRNDRWVQEYGYQAEQPKPREHQRQVSASGAVWSAEGAGHPLPSGTGAGAAGEALALTPIPSPEASGEGSRRLSHVGQLSF
jgi:hypothetical protein